jgi:hypothetical protein
MVVPSGSEPRQKLFHYLARQVYFQVGPEMSFNLSP